jgi:hypothetical protein
MTESAWPWVLEQISSSPVDVQVLPGDTETGRTCLAQLQVSEASALGAIVLNSGGLLVDHGWIRVLGGTVANGNSLARVNRFPAEPDLDWQPEDGLVVGYDVLGGVFALNGIDPAAAGRPGTPGQILYFAPDTLEWDALPLTHSQWLAWLLSGRVAQFYESLRWSGWEEESRSLTLTQGIAVYPFLWTEQAQAAAARRPVPMAELVAMAADFCGQLGLPSSGCLGSYSPKSRSE